MIRVLGSDPWLPSGHHPAAIVNKINNKWRLSPVHEEEEEEEESTLDFSTLLPAAVVNKPATRTTIPLKKPKLGFLSRPGHTTTAANQSATPCSCCRRRVRLANHQCAASVALRVSRRNPMRPVLIKPQFASIRLEGLISQRCPSAVRVPLVVDDRARDELEIFAATGWNDWRSSCCCE